MADSEANAWPFEVGGAERKAAWVRNVDRWIPVNGRLYSAAFDRWLRRKATRQARSAKAVRTFVRSNTKCRPLYMEQAMIYLHQRLVHAPVRLLSPAMRQYILELALQVVILREERKVDIADAEAIFARTIPMARRQRAIDFLDNHPDQADAEEAVLAGPYEVEHLWWKQQCQSNPLFAVFAFGVHDVTALRQMFGDRIDITALDHLRILRMAERRFRMDWRFVVTAADGSHPQNHHHRVRFACPFYLTTDEIDGRQVVLFPVSTHVWNGTMADGRRVELRLDDPFNVSVIHTFDPPLPDRDPRAAAAVPEAPAGADDAQGMEEEDRDPENNYEGEEWRPLSPGLGNDN